MASMQKFGGVRVLPLLPASMRRQQEESVQMEGESCASGDNKDDAGGVDATKTKDSKKETVFIEGTNEVK